MSTTQTFVLGAIAGLTIFLGLPLARVRHTRPEPRAALAAVATGILIFLFWDVLTNGVEPVESALDGDDWSTFAARAALLAVGFAIGLMSLVYYDCVAQVARARDARSSARARPPSTSSARGRCTGSRRRSGSRC